MLLQGLIAILPAFLFLVWYDRPGRTRFVPYFLALVCGMSIWLCMQHDDGIVLGYRIDFRLVPLIIGSLFGGLRTAVFLSLLLGVGLLFQTDGRLQTLAALMFLVAYLPLVLRFSTSPYPGGRTLTIRVPLLLCIAPLLYIALLGVIRHYGFGHVPTADEWRVYFSNGIGWLASALAGSYICERSVERIKLKTKLKEISKQYRAEAQRLQHFIDLAPLAVLFADAGGRVTQINDVFLACLEPPKNRNSIIGRNLSELTDEQSLGVASLFERIKERHGPLTDIVRYNGKTYYTVTAGLKAVPGQQSAGYLFIGYDMTELQALRDEIGRMERLSLVGQMAASITHEIRNPMAVIRGFIQLLNERSASEQQSYYRIVMEELDRVNGIINDFLSLAQNRMVEKRLCSLHDILVEIEPLIRADANMRGQEVELILCDHLEPLELSSKEIKQLVLNLARNGMEAMQAGGVLTIESADLPDSVQLRVIDQGVGIPPDRLERLFEPFYTTKTDGTGLGLPLCYSIVERHNGKIVAESAVGKGTAFIVSFYKPGIERADGIPAPDRGGFAWQG
jgi:signal transduction histidine kinase